MSDLDLIHQLEEITGKKLKEVPEEKFKLNLNNKSEINLVEENSYALSQDGDVIALFLNDYIPSRPFPFYDFAQLSYLCLKLIGVGPFHLFTLQKIKKLQTLRLASDRLNDVSFLKDLKGLTTLDLNLSLTLDDLSFLKELKGLTTLNLSPPLVDDDYFLRGRTALLSSNQVSRLSFFKELKVLTSLNLSSNQISDVSFLKDLKGLTTLNLSSNQIEL